MIKVPKIPDGMCVDEWLSQGVAVGLTDITIEAQDRYKIQSKRTVPQK